MFWSTIEEDKNIHEGDMVLLFGVRDKKRKLKYTGMGPFKVCEITPQGTIRVETLDGIKTVGFLNGMGVNSKDTMTP